MSTEQVIAILVSGVAAMGSITFAVMRWGVAKMERGQEALAAKFDGLNEKLNLESGALWRKIGNLESDVKVLAKALERAESDIDKMGAKHHARINEMTAIVTDIQRAARQGRTDR